MSNCNILEIIYKFIITTVCSPRASPRELPEKEIKFLEIQKYGVLDDLDPDQQTYTLRQFRGDVFKSPVNSIASKAVLAKYFKEILVDSEVVANMDNYEESTNEQE